MSKCEERLVSLVSEMMEKTHVQERYLNTGEKNLKAEKVDEECFLGVVVQ